MSQKLRQVLEWLFKNVKLVQREAFEILFGASNYFFNFELEIERGQLFINF